MEKYPKYFTFLFCLLAHFIAQAQTHEWAKTIYGGYPYGPNMVSLAADSNNNVYGCGAFTDTLHIDSLIYPVSPLGQYSGYIAKFDKKGKILWINTFVSENFAVIVKDVICVSNNKIYLYGIFRGSKLKLTKNDSIINANNDYIGFISEYDSLGNFINCVKTFVGDNYGVWTASRTYTSQMIMDRQGDIYLNFAKSSSTNGSINYKGAAFLSPTILLNPSLSNIQRI